MTSHKTYRYSKMKSKADVKRRADLMPDEGAAIKMLFDAYVRLLELDFCGAISIPPADPILFRQAVHV